MDFEGKDLKRLTAKPITGAIRAHLEPPYIIFQKNTAKDKELHRLFIVNVYGGSRRLAVETPLMSIFQHLI